MWSQELSSASVILKMHLHLMNSYPSAPDTSNFIASNCNILLCEIKTADYSIFFYFLYAGNCWSTSEEGSCLHTVCVMLYLDIFYQISQFLPEKISA